MKPNHYNMYKMVKNESPQNHSIKVSCDSTYMYLSENIWFSVDICTFLG